MNYARQIKRTLGLKKVPGFGIGRILPTEDNSLTHLGYPTLTQVSLFLTDIGLKKWQTEKTIYFPNQCCACSEPSQQFLAAYDYNFLGFRNQTSTMEGIPHCHGHSEDNQAKLLVTVSAWNEATTMIAMVGMNKEFLIATLKLNQVGEVFPPWQAFPGYDSFSGGWRQGNGEYWMLNVWLPYWKQLSEAEKNNYINKWNAPADWKEKWQILI
jgi:hypothetical protein